MIYFIAAAPKMGSHYVTHIVKEALDLKNISYEWKGIGKENRNDFKKLKDLLKSLEKEKDKDFIVKSHSRYAFERDMVLEIDNITVFLMWRNVHDTLYSQYNFDVNRNLTNDAFQNWYWKHGRGRSKVKYYILFHRVWESKFDLDNVVSLSYKKTKNNFENEISEKLSLFHFTNSQISKLKNNTTIDNILSKYGDKIIEKTIYNKGIVGGGKVIGELERKDIDYLLNKPHKLSKILQHNYLVIRFHPNLLWLLTGLLRDIRNTIRTIMWYSKSKQA